MPDLKKCTCTDSESSHKRCPVHGKDMKESHLSDILRIRDYIEESAIDDQFMQDLEDMGFFQDRELIESIGILLSRQVLAEDSTLLAQFGGDTKGRMLAKYLHANERVSDRAKLRDADLKRTTFEWKQFKIDPDNFLIIRGKDGWAAVRPDPAMVEQARKRAAEKGKDVGNQNWIQYQVFYITDVKNKVQVQIHRTARGGMIARRDPRAADTTISDFVADLVGRPFRAAYFLDLRDPGELDPRRLAGGRSARYGAGGASVERAKMGARALLRGQGADAAMARLARRVKVMMPKTASYVTRIISRRSGDPSYDTGPLEQQFSAIIALDDAAFLTKARDLIEYALGEIADRLPPGEDPAAAAASDPEIIRKLSKTIGDLMIDRADKGEPLL